jgi:intermediate cleaving peptidase 55
VSAAELQFGQPLHETHPHLLDPGELTPGITALEYSQRRARFAAKLPSNSIALLPAADVKFRSGSVFYDFHQECNFFYLTGFNEPEALAVIARGNTADDHEFHLFVRPKDPLGEIWEGSRSGLQAAIDVFNADHSGSSAQLSRYLNPLLASASEVFTDLPSPRSSLPSIFARLFPAATSGGELSKLLDSSKVQPLKPLIHGLRMFKSPGELANMHRAGVASGAAFNAALRRRWTSEKDLCDFLEYRFKRQGCDTSAYVPVVAAGKNALTIHYVRNDAQIEPKNLVLVDAGGEYGHYVTDITRTFPARNRFNDAERDLYSAVLAVQQTCVSLCRADANVSLDKLHEIAERGLHDQLKELGFDVGGRNMEKLFPHHLGHYIGLDVHDCPGYTRHEPLKVGQCVTIEPGVYIPDDDRWPERFRGLGIRIEDSIAVQDQKPWILTENACKSVKDIEDLRAEGLELESV